MIKWSSFVLCALFSVTLSAQLKVYSLEDCIQLAVQNSLNVKQAEVNLAQSMSQVKTQKLSFLPSANLSGSHSYNFGRSIDRFSNEFVNTTVRNNFFSINTNMVLYNGLQQQNNLKMQEANVVVAEEGLKQSRNEIALQVADIFLQYMLAKENEQLARNQKNQTQEQLERASKRLKAGSTNQGEVLNLKAQLANDQLGLVNANNAINTAKLNLKLLLMIPLEEDFSLVFKDTFQSSPMVLQTADQVFAVAVQNMPQIAMAEAQVNSAELAYKSSLGARAPNVSAFANASTVFSGQAKEIIGTPTITGSSPIGTVDATGQIVSAPQFNFNTQTIAFGDQLQNNFGQSVGVQVNVPIFNGNRVNNAILTSETNLSMTRLNLQNMKQQLKNEVSIAVNNAQQAYQQFLASKQSLEAQKLSADFAKKSYDAGALSYYDYNNARILLQNAQSQMQSAKYEYVFRKMIVNFYMNNTWKL